MKKTYVLLLLALIALQVSAQDNINTYIEAGIAHHDNGHYDKALEAYNKALILDPQSTVVNYEMALSYFYKKDYENCIARADIVIKKKKDNLLNGYLIKGSALDMKGNTNESIKLFEKAIRKFPDEYLLYYNLALNHYKLNQMDKARKNVIKAIENNPDHGTSHWMLANIESALGHTVQSLLANHYFLFIEPDTPRAVDAYALLQKNFGGNVTQDSNNAITVNISVSEDNDPFSAAAMMLGLLGATHLLPENAGKTPEELFVENTGAFFKILGELDENKQPDIFWQFYVPFFYNIAQSEHLETYCMNISQSANVNAKAWTKANAEKIKAFKEWLKY